MESVTDKDGLRIAFSHFSLFPFVFEGMDVADDDNSVTSDKLIRVRAIHVVRSDTVKRGTYIHTYIHLSRSSIPSKHFTVR